MLLFLTHFPCSNLFVIILRSDHFTSFSLVEGTIKGLLQMGASMANAHCKCFSCKQKVHSVREMEHCDYFVAQWTSFTSMLYSPVKAIYKMTSRPG